MSSIDIIISILLGTLITELTIRGIVKLEGYYERRKLKKGKKEK